MRYWKKLSDEQINQRIFSALEENVDYRERVPLGVPASHLDEKVFYSNAPILKDAPFLSTLLKNPNHIGCHTLGESESFFQGTQAIEKELIALCAEDILNGEAGAFDGYVAAGGTEANTQAIWIYRNYFQRDHGAKPAEIAIICSEDAHYSMPKAANLLGIKLLSVPVDSETRAVKREAVEAVLDKAEGVRYFIVVCNMMTTMYGSVDDANLYADILESRQLNYKIHVDGAYGGFFFPFAEVPHTLDFSNTRISSFTLDAHKMVQAPYGTGIFLARKGWMHYAYTEEAQYVMGLDATLSGSRSGANAVSIWMILMTYGPHGWFEKIHILNYRTNWFCKALRSLDIPHFRHAGSNIVTIKAEAASLELARQFGLVPDDHETPQWFKVVIMDHVRIDHLSELVEALK
ncbi:MAG: pyridoxal-dependent decarboxylase [Chitinophagales bacterium]|nr:pyridoxal-dependent decarboxylase [Chitinophagales bacterium]